MLTRDSVSQSLLNKSKTLVRILCLEAIDVIGVWYDRTRNSSTTRSCPFTIGADVTGKHCSRKNPATLNMSVSDSEKIGLLTRVLAFYADEDSWENWLLPDEGYNSRAKEDDGQRARDAIEQIRFLSDEGQTQPLSQK
jgi:hypothetical protein